MPRLAHNRSLQQIKIHYTVNARSEIRNSHFLKRIEKGCKDKLLSVRSHVHIAKDNDLSGARKSAIQKLYLSNRERSEGSKDSYLKRLKRFVH